MKCFWLVLIAGLTGAVRADDVWLRPERPFVTPGAMLRVLLSRSESFDADETAISPDQIVRTVVRLGDQSPSLVNPVARAEALALSMTLPRPGVAVVAIELKAQTIEIPERDVEGYLRAIHASDGLRAAWLEVPTPRRWRETCVRTAKAFVRVGEPPANERSWSEPSGLSLEIVPELDPTALQAGDELRVRVIRSGTPLAGCVVAFVSRGETHEHVVVTDEDGRAAAPLDVRGAWLVRGVYLRRSSTPDPAWASEVTTLTLDVK